MELVDRINIESSDGTPISDLDTRIKTLLLCVKRTIPGSRAFGLSRDYLDDNINVAANTLAAELQEGMDKYVPEAQVESVSMEYDIEGKLETTITIERGDAV